MRGRVNVENRVVYTYPRITLSVKRDPTKNQIRFFGGSSTSLTPAGFFVVSLNGFLKTAFPPPGFGLPILNYGVDNGIDDGSANEGELNIYYNSNYWLNNQPLNYYQFDSSLCWRCIYDCLYFDDGVSAIGKMLFYGQPIQEFNVPSQITTIYEGAFAHSDLETVTFNGSGGTLSVMAYTFSACKITSVDLSSYDKIEYKNIGTGTKSEDYPPDSAYYMFANCQNLTTAILPPYQTWDYCLGSMFVNCTSLTSVNIPTTLTKIAYQMFFNTGFTTLVIPTGVTEIKASAYRSCQNLTSVTLPTTLTLLSDTVNNKNAGTGEAYQFADCPNLVEVICLATTPPTMEANNVFANANANLVIKVPSASLSAYQSALNWSTYSSKMVGI